MAHIGDRRRAGAPASDERGRIGGKKMQEYEGDHRDAEEDQSAAWHEPSCQNQNHQPLPRCVGSRRSRKASPTRLKDKRRRQDEAAPGMKTSHGAAWK